MSALHLAQSVTENMKSTRNVDARKAANNLLGALKTGACVVLAGAKTATFGSQKKIADAFHGASVNLWDLEVYLNDGFRD